MTSINHLPATEQEHFILCACGAYVDMRNLGEVFAHEHAGLPEPEWSSSLKKGTAVLYTKTGKQLPLN